MPTSNNTYNDQLYQAVCNGHIEQARECLANGADINGFYHGQPLLRHATETKNKEMIQFLLDNQAQKSMYDMYRILVLFQDDLPAFIQKYQIDINMTNGSESLLSLAIEYDDVNQLQALQKCGLRIPQDALIQSIEYGGGLEVLQFLLANGLNPNQVDNQNRTPLSVAIQRGWVEPIEILLKAKANPNHVGANNQTPLMEAARYSRDRKAIDLLVQYGANPNYTNVDNQTPLSIAVQNGCADLVSALIDNKADITKAVPPETGKTLMDIVTDNDTLQILYKAGLTFDLSKAQETFLLHRAILCQDKATVDELLKTRYDLTIPDKNGNTPLHFLYKADEEFILYFLDACQKNNIPLPINAQNNDGNTFLHLLTTRNWFDNSLVQKAIDLGADVHISNNEGNTPLHFAVAMGNEEHISMLVQKGASINVQNRDGNSPGLFYYQLMYQVQIDHDSSSYRQRIMAGIKNALFSRNDYQDQQNNAGQTMSLMVNTYECKYPLQDFTTHPSEIAISFAFPDPSIQYIPPESHKKNPVKRKQLAEKPIPPEPIDIQQLADNALAIDITPSDVQLPPVDIENIPDVSDGLTDTEYNHALFVLTPNHIDTDDTTEQPIAVEYDIATWMTEQPQPNMFIDTQSIPSEISTPSIPSELTSQPDIQYQELPTLTTLEPDESDNPSDGAVSVETKTDHNKPLSSGQKNDTRTPKEKGTKKGKKKENGSDSKSKTKTQKKTTDTLTLNGLPLSTTSDSQSMTSNRTDTHKNHTKQDETISVAIAQNQQKKDEFWSKNWQWIVGLITALGAVIGVTFLTSKYKKQYKREQAQTTQLEKQVRMLENKLADLTPSASSATANQSVLSTHANLLMHDSNVLYPQTNNERS